MMSFDIFRLENWMSAFHSFFTFSSSGANPIINKQFFICYQAWPFYEKHNGFHKLQTFKLNNKNCKTSKNKICYDWLLIIFYVSIFFRIFGLFKLLCLRPFRYFRPFRHLDSFDLSALIPVDLNIV